MWSLIIRQMNTSMKQNRLMERVNRPMVSKKKEDGDGRNWRLGLTDVNYYIWDVQTRSYFRAQQRTIFSIL